MGSLLDLRLMVPREDMGKLLEKHFQKSPERIYSKIMEILLAWNDARQDTGMGKSTELDNVIMNGGEAY
jgi:hypothetical protein